LHKSSYPHRHVEAAGSCEFVVVHCSAGFVVTLSIKLNVNINTNIIVNINVNIDDDLVVVVVNYINER